MPETTKWLPTLVEIYLKCDKNITYELHPKTTQPKENETPFRNMRKTWNLNDNTGKVIFTLSKKENAIISYLQYA